MRHLEKNNTNGLNAEKKQENDREKQRFLLRLQEMAKTIKCQLLFTKFAVRKRRNFLTFDGFFCGGFYQHLELTAV